MNAVVASGSDETPAVKAAFSNGMQAMMSAGTPTASMRTKANAILKDSGASSPLSPEQQRTVQSAGELQISGFFTSTAQTAAKRNMQGMLVMDQDPNQINDGAGVSKIDFLKVSVNGVSAHVDADVTAWAKSRVRLSPEKPWMSTSPISTMRFAADLVHDSSGVWKIESFHGDFEPDQVP